MPKRSPKPARKRTSKPLSKSRSVRTKSTKSFSPVARPASTTEYSASSKQSRVIAMLKSPNGATIDAMMLETGWQQHSVRGFLAGVVRKKLKLHLQSDKIAGNRIYRISDRPQAKSTDAPTKAERRSSKRRSA